MDKASQTGRFAWTKFAIVLVGFFLWLRGMRLCVDDGKQLHTNSWGVWLFTLGFAGLLLSILLPAYVVGASVLAATCVVPFWQYKRWRNKQVAESSPRLRWKHLLFSLDERFGSRNRVEVKLHSGTPDGTPDRKIVLLGKSISRENVDGGTHGAANQSSGFQAALGLIDQAIARRATDLHVSTKDDEVALRLRIDGELVSLEPLPIELGMSVINVFKVLCDLNIADKRRSQDGSFRAEVEGRRLSLRVSAQGTNTGEKLSIRILDPALNFSNFSLLGMTDHLQEQMMTALNRKYGLILFVGATGAGKSTTAYAALRSFDSSERNIVTIEDPIEYSIPSIDQIEVNIRAGQTFQSGLRSLLRQDADVVLIGEIRDAETAQIACQAATTGQLVLATLHANDSVSAVFRMLDLGSDRHNVGAALRTVVSQQLIRKLCPNCRIAYQPNDEIRTNLNLGDFQGELYRNADPLQNTCLNCNGRGFLRRTGIFELLNVTQPIRDLIRENAGASTIFAAARDSGMKTLWDNGVRLVHQGVISVEDFYRYVDDP